MNIRFLPRWHLAAITLCLPLLCLRAQGDDKLKLKVRISTDEQAEDKREPRSLFPMNDKYLMVMRGHNEGAGIRSFSKAQAKFELYDRIKLTVVRSQDPALRTRSADVFLTDLVWFGGRPVMVATRRDTIKGFVELHWQVPDPSLTRTHRPFDPLCSFDARVLGTGQVVPSGSAFYDPFLTAFSPDTSLMLVHAPVVQGIDGKSRHLLVVVDHKMSVVWQRVIETLPADHHMDVQLDNKGNAYLLMRRSLAGKEMKKDTSTYALEIDRVNGSGVTPCEMDLAKERHIKSARFLPLKGDRIVVAGIHGGADGTGAGTLMNFIADIPPGEAKLATTFTRKIEYDADDGWMAKGMRLMAVLPRPNGGFYLLNEYYLPTDRPDTKLALSGQRWVHGPIMAICLDASGKEEWTGMFKRLHLAYEPMVGEVLPIVHNDQLVLILLDSDALVERRKAKDKRIGHLEMKSPYTAFVTFSTDGSSKAKSILRNAGATDFIQGTRLWNTGKGEYFALGASKLGGSRLLPVKIELGE